MPCDQHGPFPDPYDGPQLAPRGDAEPGRTPGTGSGPEASPRAELRGGPDPVVGPYPPTDPVPSENPETGPPPLRLRNPTDLIAALPYLVAQPLADAVIVLVLGEGRVLGVLYSGLDHLDHVLTPDRSGQAAVRAALAAQGTGMIVAGFGRPARLTPHVEAVLAEARARGLPVLEAIGVAGGRYRSYLCRDSACCPPEGTPFDPSVSPVPAEAVLRGLVPGDEGEENRIRALLEPVCGAPRTEATEAVEAEEARIRREDPGRALADRWIPQMRQALLREGGERVTEPAALARMAVHLTELRVRDAMWTRITPDTAELHLRLWSRVVRHVPARLRPAPAALLAVAAWQHDDQRLARAALEVALTADPRYPMAVLMSRALAWGLPAERWRGFLAARLEEEPG